MLQLQLHSFSLALCGAAALGTTLWLFSKHSEKMTPPGPTSYPLIGALFSWPHRNAWLTFSKWRAMYGDIIYVKVVGKKFIILNSSDIATTLLDRQGAACSDRPALFFANDLIGWKDSPILCCENHPYFQPARQMMNKAVGSKSVDEWISLQEHEVLRFMRRIVDEPHKLEYHGRKFTGTIILRILYGYDVKPGNDEYVDLIDKVNMELNLATTPGNFLVEFIPALCHVPRWMPGTRWMDTMDQMRASLEEVLTKPINFVEDRLNSQTAHPSFVQTVLLGPEPDRRRLAWVAEALYTGGADTTLSAIRTFFLCMTLFPDSHKKAQEELDEIIGKNTLPKWADRGRLPYVMAIVKEVLRWGAIVPMGLPHTTIQDLTYNGYFIPTGAIIMANIWELTHDPVVYPGPDAFIPERFLGSSPQRDPSDLIFGFGRRICPGRHLAASTLFSVISRVLSMLSTRKKIGIDGEPIVPTVGYAGLTGAYPFECDIIPRDSEADVLVRGVEDEPY